ncbi:hypothetical protein [Deinococcus budaensis]|uniref:Uncharacterized protein n=1 Tax=Deinococcus budaensis TaxID=1665626 RepID=A0A7W8LQC5_9DEIO|nr:hypothetical protein [Deinococcus budaensis]MBB5234470.1 hypothetical protein [Deinococcus budaensis]
MNQPDPPDLRRLQQLADRLAAAAADQLRAAHLQLDAARQFAAAVAQLPKL